MGRILQRAITSTGRKIQQVARQANNDLHGSTWLDDVAYKGLQDFFPQLRRYTGWCLTLSAKCHESSVEHDIPKTDSYTKNWTDRNAARKGLSQLSNRTKSLPNTMNTMTWPSCLRFAFSLRTRLSLLNWSNVAHLNWRTESELRLIVFVQWKARKGSLKLRI